MSSNSKPYTTDFVASRDGTTIGYRQLGAGPGLILVHGGMQASQNFMRLAVALAEAFTVYVPDRRGRGLSGPHGADYGTRKECEDLEALVLKSGAANVFGLSSGAIVCMRAALTLPSIRRLAIYEPPLSIENCSPTGWVSRFDSEVAEGRLPAAFVTVLKGLDAAPDTPREELEAMMMQSLENDAKNVREGDLPLAALIPTMHFDAQLVMETEGTLEDYKSMGAEVLLLGGSKSQAFLRVALDALSKTLPKVRRVEFAGLDHVGADNRGDPLVVASELKRFFS